jgi:hypothetical protein
MRQLFTALSNVIIVTCDAFVSFANALGNIAKITEESTGEMLDESRAERAAANAKRMQAAQ